MTWGRQLECASGDSSRTGVKRRQKATLVLNIVWFALVVLLPRGTLAQTQPSQPASPSGSPASSQSPSQPEGVNADGYVVHQSIEVGYRFSDQNGNSNMYDTLVNLQQGPRLLEQTLSMQSPAHTGFLFDNLLLSSFGWGGDPNNALRLRADKGKWYDFQGSFRRDQNFFDYDLLANPLNPPSSTPNIPITESPHLFASVRRMSDVDLTLLPQSKVSLRIGYSRNNMGGPSYSSFHEGTDVSLFQPQNFTVNEYRIGIDFKLAPRTVVSYDQTLNYFKGDTSWQLNPFAEVPLPGGAGSVSLGLPINTGAAQPCAVPAGSTSLVDPATGTLTNIACNAYFSYLRTQRVRTSTPTERYSVRSSAIERLDFTASYAYSASDTSTPLNESFDGLVSRTRTRAYTINGFANAKQISNVAQAGATFHVRRNLKLIYTFYLWNYRIPESFLSTEEDQNVAGTGACLPPTCSLLVPLNDPSIIPTTIPTSTQTSFNQNMMRNQLQLAWNLSKTMGFTVGFRYSRQNLIHILDFQTADVDNILVNGLTPLITFWARPSSQLRFNFSYEHTNYDNMIVRIGPRKQAGYRFQAGYTPRPWAVLGGSVNLQESSNNDQLTDYRAHNRNYGLTASINPRERFSLDFSYNFNGVLQNSLICFNDTPPLGVTLPVVTGAGSCAAGLYNDPANPLLTNAYFTSNTNYGLATIMVKPMKRVTTRVGYSLSSVRGTTPQFNILQPLGALSYNYQQPVGNLSVDMGHAVTGNAGWNYYQYNEQSFAGPTLPRYFHANNVTLSLVYAF